MHRVIRLLVLGLAVALLIMSAGESQAQGTWTRVTPVRGATCSDGSAYSFWVRRTESSRLLIYFQGGGACYDLETCFGWRSYDPTVGDDDDPSLPGRGGILDFTNPENPFLDYNIVFVPYCTGDFHLGDRVVTWNVEGGGQATMRFKGAANARAALNWTYTHFRAPESVFVSGCSAGAVGSAYHAPAIMRRYAGVPVTQMGDSAGGYRGDLDRILSAWGVNASSFEAFYLQGAAANPTRRFSELNTAQDETQLTFQRWMGSDLRSVQDILLGNLLDVHTQAANFRSYTAPGNVHCVTLWDDFYSMSISGTRVLDWVANLALGNDVGNVYFDGFPLWFTPPQ